MNEPAVLQTVALPASPTPWPTLDPFLFCVHHNDAYPAGDGALGPNAALEGRALGSDFSARDGWSMYHGRSVPGFPQHPHRGFETLTYARQGFIDHSDSLGATARFGAGDAQWMTAGAGIVHAEMFPLLHPVRANPLELFQIWINLPSADKLVAPHFSMLWREDTPRVEVSAGVWVTVIAGRLEGREAAAPPPHSWAGHPENDVAVWHLAFEAGGAWCLPPAANPAVHRTLYHFSGASLDLGAHHVTPSSAALLDGSKRVSIHALEGASEVLILQGRPIGEPVAQHGPFVMNTREEIEQALHDYRETGFGGWPWPVADPTHSPERGRFARHADARSEERAT